MSLLTRLFPSARPRRRRTAAVLGGFSVLALAGVWITRTVAGKPEASPCESSNDCKRGLLCAEGSGESPKGRTRRGNGIKQCAKPCLADGDCSGGLSCESGYEHTLGPRGGKHKAAAKACLGE